MAPVRTQLLDLSQAPSHAQNPHAQSPTAHVPATPAQQSAPPAYPQPSAPAWPSSQPPAAHAPHAPSPQQGWPSPSGAPQPWPVSSAPYARPAPNAHAPAWPHPGSHGAHAPAPPVNPSAPSSDERTTALLAHVGALFMPVLVPLLIFATSDKKPFVRAVAAQAVASQIGATALGMVLPVLSVMAVLVLSQSKDAQGLIGVFAMWPFMSMLLVLAFGTYAIIRGAMCAHRGEVWRVPLIGGLVARLTGTNG